MRERERRVELGFARRERARAVGSDCGGMDMVRAAGWVGAGVVGVRLSPARFYKFWASRSQMPKLLKPHFCCFGYMVFKSILQKDRLKHQNFWQDWGTKHPLNSSPKKLEHSFK